MSEIKRTSIIRFIVLLTLCLFLVTGVTMIGEPQNCTVKKLTAILLPPACAEDADDITVDVVWSDDYAEIGHPITLHYELSGGSGEFPKVTVQSLYEHGTRISYGGDHQQTDKKSADCVIVPAEGTSLSVQIYGRDSADRSFYLDLQNIPIKPNPDVPVQCEYNRDPVRKEEELVLSYSIGNCDAFTGVSRWVIQDEKGYSTGDLTDLPDSTAGEIRYTPKHGSSVYFEIQGATGDGTPVYYESDPVAVLGSGKPTVVAEGVCGTSANWSLDDTGTLTVSGTGAMNDYDWEEPAPWYDRADEISSVIIEKGVTVIGEFAFSRCTSLKSVIMANSITSIGAGAFDDCTALTDISLSAELTEIGDSAFQGCEKLQSITLPASLRSIGYCAFMDCSLTRIDILKDSGAKTWDFFYLGETDDDFQLYHIDLPYGITEVGFGAFCNNDFPIDKPDFILPADLQMIESEAFSGTNYRYLWLSNKVNTIGESAFAGSNDLRYVYIPLSVTSIEANAFPKSTIILGISGVDNPSYAETYARKNDLVFLQLEDPYGGNG